MHTGEDASSLSSCDYKAPFLCRVICIRRKPVIGRAVMARREGEMSALVQLKQIASECKSQKTYKPLNPRQRKGRGAERKGGGVSCLPVFHMSQKRWFYNHRFFIT